MITNSISGSIASSFQLIISGIEVLAIFDNGLILTFNTSDTNNLQVDNSITLQIG